LLNFLWKNCSIFNNSCTVGLNITRPSQCSPTHKGFPIVSRVRWEGGCSLGDLNMTSEPNKRNIQTTFLNKYIILSWFGRSQCDKQNKQTTFLNK
jgi:hypothetical protein